MGGATLARNKINENGNNVDSQIILNFNTNVSSCEVWLNLFNQHLLQIYTKSVNLHTESPIMAITRSSQFKLVCA